MAEGTGFENRRAGNRTGGSNPSASVCFFEIEGALSLKLGDDPSPSMKRNEHSETRSKATSGGGAMAKSGEYLTISDAAQCLGVSKDNVEALR